MVSMSFPTGFMLCLIAYMLFPLVSGFDDISYGFTKNITSFLRFLTWAICYFLWCLWYFLWARHQYQMLSMLCLMIYIIPMFAPLPGFYGVFYGIYVISYGLYAIALVYITYVIIWYILWAYQYYHLLSMVCPMGSPVISYAFCDTSYCLYHKSLVSM